VYVLCISYTLSQAVVHLQRSVPHRNWKINMLDQPRYVRKSTCMSGPKEGSSCSGPVPSRFHTSTATRQHSSSPPGANMVHNNSAEIMYDLSDSSSGLISGTSFHEEAYGRDRRESRFDDAGPNEG
jgi:hypothetical protein